MHILIFFWIENNSSRSRKLIIGKYWRIGETAIVHEENPSNS